MTGYSAFRIFEESLRADPSEHFLGLRLNFYVASALTFSGLIWFIRSQRKPSPSDVTQDSVADPAERQPGHP